MFGGNRSFLSGVLASLVLVLFFVSSPGAQDDGQAPGHIKKNGIDVDIRSLGKQISDALQQAGTPAGGGDTSPGAAFVMHWNGLHTSLKSAAAKTALTPGSASASDVSIDTMLACGKGLRRNAAWSCRGSVMSST